MAYLVRRRDGRLEIRETQGTERGPRARTLVSFRGALTPDVLEQARERAARPLDRGALLTRARELGVPLAKRRTDRAARELLRALRRGAPDPVLVHLLLRALERLPATPAGPELAEVSEWVGAGEAERGEALRGLLRVSDRIAASAARRRPRPRRAFPRFSSRRRRRVRSR
jgi:hypothetical protein